MKAHLREMHGVPEGQRFHIIHAEKSPQLAEVCFQELDKPPEELRVKPYRSSEPKTSDAGSQPGGWLPNRNIYQSFIVDTNCVNSRGNDDDLNQLEKWAQNGIISLLTTEIAQKEMLRGNDHQRAEKAYTYIFTGSAITSEHELRTMTRIESILFPTGARNQNQLNDVEIVFNAVKYMRPLITNDGGSKRQPGGILGNAAKLQSVGVTVMRPEEAVERVRRAIQQCDFSARKIAELSGEPLPSWVGAD